jgi:hypothetical protein
MQLEAGAEQPTDFRQAGARIADGLAQEHPERAKDLADLAEVPAARSCEQCPDTTEDGPTIWEERAGTAFPPPTTCGRSASPRRAGPRPPRLRGVGARRGRAPAGNPPAHASPSHANEWLPQPGRNVPLVLVEPCPRRCHGAPSTSEIMLLEAGAEQPADLREAGAHRRRLHRGAPGAVEDFADPCPEPGHGVRRGARHATEERSLQSQPTPATAAKHAARAGSVMNYRAHDRPR